ncbi:MAG: TRAP transporter small permease [Clostridia bacterium]|nr:TRAP transporter small permease [Clostridia bacterium]
MQLIKKVTDGLVVTFFISLILLVFAQVIFRFVFHNSQPWIDELSRFLFVWIIYLGGTITIRKGINITFDLLIDSLTSKTWMVVFTIVNILCIFFLLLIVVLGFNISFINRVQASSLLGLNMGIVTLAIPIGGILMIVSQIEYYLTTLKKRKEGIC